jgi:hypothetical protein
MNPIPALNEAFCIRLAETLLHFLWQGTLIALLALGSGFLLRRGAARMRYGVYVAALALMALAPVVTFWLVADPRTAAPVPAHANVTKQATPIPAAKAPAVGLGAGLSTKQPMMGGLQSPPASPVLLIGA